MTPQDTAIVEKVAQDAIVNLKKHFSPGFGIFPSADPDDNYFNQLWSRDFAHAAGNYFTLAQEEAVLESLETLFFYQRKKGVLPFRVEREYTIFKIVPWFEWFSKPVFNLVERGVRRRKEKPLYEGEDILEAGDTIPVILITVGFFSAHSARGKKFASAHYHALKKATDFFRKKVDPEDGFAVIGGKYPDWADTIRKSGKLGTINIWWAKALEYMAEMAKEFGYEEDAVLFTKEYQFLKKSIVGKLYNAEGAFFRTMVGGTRLSTVASIYGSLFILDATEAARVQETLDKRVRHSSGLKNFDPSYPLERIFWIVRLAGHAGYHNMFVWPWVTCQNILVKIKIALHHPDHAVKARYKQEAIDELVAVAKLYTKAGGAYEVFEADRPKPGGGMLYESARNFMGSLAGYMGAYNKLKELHWI